MAAQGKLGEFVRWFERHVTGDEKGQAQIFLDHLFRAFGLGGVLEAGAETEFRIRQGTAAGGGTAFADLVWKPVVLVEMKKRGEPLQKHYRQAFDYWTRLVPNRPRYVVLCNFDEFWIYDFETDLDTPKDKILTKDLAHRWGALAFLRGQRPSFQHDREAVTREAADQLAFVFNRLLWRDVPRDDARRFILQMLVALFAEDIGLLKKYFLSRLLDDCTTPADTYDLIGGLFEAMNRPGNTGGRFKGVACFNGGLFAQPAKLELRDTELVALREAAKFDWSKVQPEIFGTLFQHSMGAEKRHAFGAHFTHPADIMKIVGPTLVEPWREQIEGATTLTRLNQLADRLHHFRVLDPACGSGNFLYIAYRELKRLEARLYERMETEFKSQAKQAGQLRLSFLSAQNFYGLDILPFAVEIAKVTMMIGRKLAIDELHITEPALPLDNLDQNFLTGDALLDAAGHPTPWPHADVIIGNPPFLGSRYFAKEHGYDYVRKIHTAYPEIPKMADYCVYWIRKAHDHLPLCTKEDPVAGRAGLVGTQNIRNNQSRVGGLDHVLKDGTIIEAVENQPWSGEADVHVSIVNWVKTQDVALLPEQRKLWFKVEPARGARKPRKKGNGPAAKQYELDVRECEAINSALSDEIDVSTAHVLAINVAPKRVFTGQNPCHDGFKLEPTEARGLLKSEPDAEAVLFPYMTGLDLVTLGVPSRWIIDFGQRHLLEAAHYSAAFTIVKEVVLPDVLAKAEKEQAATGRNRTRWTRMVERWWQFRDPMPGTVGAIDPLARYIVCPRVTKRLTFAFVSSDIRPDMQLMVFAFDDDYSFGILQSSAHWLWFITKCSKLTERFRYTATSVFDTFPWPQFPGSSSRRKSAQTASSASPAARSRKEQSGLTSAATVAKITAVAEAGRQIRRVRFEALQKLKGGLRALYRTLELPGANPLKDAHAALDAAVLAAYGFSAKEDLLAQLLELNQAVAARIERGEPVTAPGVPAGFPNPESLMTGDCIQPPDVGGKGAMHPDSTAESEALAAHAYFVKEASSPYRPD